MIKLIKNTFSPNAKLQKQVEQLKEQIEFMAKENVEFLQKLKELNEEKDMVKKLCRTQEQELVEAFQKRFEAEEKFKDMEAQLKMYKIGLETHEGEIKAISICKISEATDTSKETWAPVIFTIDQKGKKILKREAKPDTELQYAVDNAKICFIQLFDPIQSVLN